MRNGMHVTDEANRRESTWDHFIGTAWKVGFDTFDAAMKYDYVIRAFDDNVFYV